MSRNTVIVVEDDPIMRKRIVSAIHARVDLDLIAAAANCAEARKAMHQGMPRVLLTDLGLPDGDGTLLIREAARHPGTDIMVLTIFGDERHVVAALEAGATGYLLKDSPREDIGASVMRLISGESPISAKIAHYLVRRFQRSATSVLKRQDESPQLTEREQEVLEHIAQGFSYAEVGQLLQMSPQTVPSHIKRIYRKLAVRSRSEAVFEAVNLGLIRLHK